MDLYYLKDNLLARFSITRKKWKNCIVGFSILMQKMTRLLDHWAKGCWMFPIIITINALYKSFSISLDFFLQYGNVEIKSNGCKNEVSPLDIVETMRSLRVESKKQGRQWKDDSISWGIELVECFHATNFDRYTQENISWVELK
jgi:hypothetical protein